MRPRLSIILGLEMKKLAVLQSNYIPWKGYFDLIRRVDECILYDDVQYTKNDWRNRNIIKTPGGPQWMTIPVRHRLGMKIRDIKTLDERWRRKHWNTLTANYAKARFFKEYRPIFEELYLGRIENRLSDINHSFIAAINGLLKISTKLSWSWEYELKGDKTGRLINLCFQTGATEYVSGPAAKGYLEEEAFARNRISLSWMDYSGYPEYDQLFPPFLQNVTIVDLIFNLGTKAMDYMKCLS